MIIGLGKSLKLYIYVIPTIRRISDDVIEIFNIFLLYRRDNSLFFSRNLIVRSLTLEIAWRILDFVFIGYIYILYVPVVIESIDEGSLFLLIINIIKRWRVKFDSYNIRTRIAGSGVFTSFFSGFAPWVFIYFIINDNYIIGILSFKVFSYYLFFCSAILATDLSFQFFVFKVIFGIFFRILWFCLFFFCITFRSVFYTFLVYF